VITNSSFHFAQFAVEFMSDHWKALADLLGTPPLDRGTVEPSQDVEATKSSVKTVDAGSVVKIKEPRESKPAFSAPVVDKVNEMEEGVSSQQSSPSTSYDQPKAVENQKNMEDKNSVTPAVPKRSAGWDALARLFGLSSPPPDADVPLPESPKEKEPEARGASTAPAAKSVPAAKNAPEAKVAPVSKPVENELDLTQLGWPAPKNQKSEPNRERAAQPERGGQQERGNSSESTREPVSARDTAGREPSARDGGSREGGRERGGRDSGGREGGPRDRNDRDRNDRDRNDRDRNDRGRRPERDTAQGESGAREPVARERGPRDGAASREAAGPRENEARESGRRDRGGRDRGPREGSSRDANVRENGSRDAGTRETPVREVAARDSGDGERSERRSGRDQRGGRRDGRPDRRSERTGERSNSERSDTRFAESRRDETPIYDEPFVEVDGDEVDDLSFGPPRGRAEKPRPATPAWEVEAEGDFEEASEEGAMPERRGRRRRGRRRGGAGRGEAADARPAARPDERDNRSKRDIPKRGIDDADLDYEAEVVEDVVVDDDAVAPVEPSASERRGRRRRRRGGRRPDAAVGPAADLDNEELDLSEGYNLPGLLADEIEASEDEDGIHAAIPTWEDTVKILVTTNIEARHRPDQRGGGGNRQGGGNQGGHSHGGNQGGRGRGGNRSHGKR
ncbi:MAG: hypothetical protein J0M26_20635, partial [Planctomycetes bacterium]|nr:hypothetical protein [Planctomycetota bacterium]